MDSSNFSKGLAAIISKARYDSDISQETMAIELNVSKRTIINWEKGLSHPDLVQTLMWFKVCGKNPMEPFLEFLYPETFIGIDQNSDDAPIKNAVIKYIDSMPNKTVRQLAYIFFGKHQSSPISIMEMITAHLHNDIKGRVAAARVIADCYDMCISRNEIVCEDSIRPDMDLLNKSIELGKEAYMNGKTGYSSNIFG